MKIRLVGAELFHADGRMDRQTDMTKRIVAIRKSANAPIKAKQDSVNFQLANTRAKSSVKIIYFEVSRFVTW